MVTRIAILLLGLLASQAVSAEPLKLVTFHIPPLVSLSNRAAPSGYAIDVVRRMFDRAGDDYELEIQPVKRAMRSAIDTPGTCVFPIDRSQEREASLSWIGPVSVARHGFYSAPARPYTLRSLTDARPYTIGSYLGSGVGEYLQSLDYKVHLATQNHLGLLMLQAGRVDLWISDTRSAPIIAERLGVELGEPELVFFTTLRSLGCNRDTDPARLAALETALLELYNSGELQDILQLEP
ncbi:MAG: transporter substrate-binding domain-containing protein [Marinobacter sp.]|uniref:substrate-binding periplasmic protein n=1 Tax=Marinobacter sp. TaxID=50741 RepID=UPI00299E9FAF|nr:transporter substrate-binding domain-containing protein [Marinobacter sp.]MDX1755354.1 transporter substrate-binding domain-containing protein [Marinobacter sp.]